MGNGDGAQTGNRAHVRRQFKETDRGAWLAQLLKHLILDLEVGSWSPALRVALMDAPGGSAVKLWGSGPNLGSQDRVPHWAPCMEPASPSACACASLSLS